jgi:serine/threonine-protein kinase
VISQHLTTPPPRLSDHRPDLSALDIVSAAALSKDPAERYPNCTEFARDLERRATRAFVSPATATQAAIPGESVSAAALTQRAGAPPASPSSQSPMPPLRLGGSRSSLIRRRLPWIAGVAVTVILIAGGAWAVPRLTGGHKQDAGPSISSSRAQSSAPLPNNGSTPVGTITTGAVHPGSATAQSAAGSIKTAIPEVTESITITEDNDPNHLIGRPNGYVAASVLVDSRLPRCTDLGADCGAMVEQWPDQAAAQNRAAYIQSVLKSMPMLGQEWDMVRGGLLLRGRNLEAVPGQALRIGLHELSPRLTENQQPACRRRMSSSSARRRRISSSSTSRRRRSSSEAP